jgi:hypothetical protein
VRARKDGEVFTCQFKMPATSAAMLLALIQSMLPDGQRVTVRMARAAARAFLCQDSEDRKEQLGVVKMRGHVTSADGSSY